MSYDVLPTIVRLALVILSVGFNYLLARAYYQKLLQQVGEALLERVITAWFSAGLSVWLVRTFISIYYGYTTFNQWGLWPIIWWYGSIYLMSALFAWLMIGIHHIKWLLFYTVLTVSWQLIIYYLAGQWF